MAAQLPLISPQNYEVIRNKIKTILLEELTQQAVLDNTFTAPSDVYIERFYAFDKQELPAVNICFYSGDYDNKNQTFVYGEYIFYIDCYTNSNTVGTERGDKLAQIKLLKLIGKIRAILEAPVYKTLSITPGAIKRTAVKHIRIVYKEQDPTALNDICGRVYFSVTSDETVPLITPEELELWSSKATIEETGLGYLTSNIT